MSDTSAQTAWEAWCAKWKPRKTAQNRAHFMAGYVQALLDAANDADALKGGMAGNSKFADGYRTACVDIARRARAADAGGSDE